MKRLLEELIQSGVQDGAFPSAVAAVGCRCALLARACAGRLFAQDGPPADFETRYDMASLTKTLAPTMIALRAVERGDLTLGDPLARFFDAPADKRDISIRQIMTHTGGFSPHFDLMQLSSSPEDADSAILCHPLMGTPGDMPRYSCMGYILLGKILEHVYGKPLNEIAWERVFKPLGMTETSYLPKGGNIAATEVDPHTGSPLVGIVHDENARYLGGVSGNAGVFSNIDDMMRFTAMLACEGGGFLSPATLHAAIHNYTPGFEQHRGLGFQIGGTDWCFLGELTPHESFGHTGFTGTSIAIDPSTGFWAILLTNRVNPTRANTKILRFRRMFHNVLYASFTRG